jgi:sugar O-acyltransferase (sialic acid O-acetyltransferase NeuD family)
MIIVGAKGFAKEVLEIFSQQGKLEHIAMFDNVNDDLPDILYGRFPILRNDDEVKNWFKSTKSKEFTLGIGSPKNRKILTEKFQNFGGILKSSISPHASIGTFNNKIEDGANIMTGTVITNDISIGKAALINLNCTIGHDCQIGDFLELSPGVHISGNCKLGSYVNIGTNATILPNVILGDNVVVGAGAVVTKDIPSNSLVVGIPGKVIKELNSI